MAQSPQRSKLGPVPKARTVRTEEDNYPPPAVQDDQDRQVNVVKRGGGPLPLAIWEQPESYPPPEPVQTIADEQRERSAYIESVGVEAFKAENDMRTDEGQVQVEGAQYPGDYDSPPPIDSRGRLSR
jgi:hypothetical protein